MLYEDYKAVTGKEIGFSSFSSQLSTLMGKKDSIMKHEIVENPIDTRFWYGPKEWFSEGRMDEKYLAKKEAT